MRTVSSSVFLRLQDAKSFSCPFPENTESLTQASSWPLLKQLQPGTLPCWVSERHCKDEAGELVLVGAQLSLLHMVFWLWQTMKQKKLKMKQPRMPAGVRLESRGRCEEEGECPYQVNLPPSTIQLPKQFSRIEEVFKKFRISRKL